MKIKNIKRMVALVMSVLLLFGLAACGNEKQGAGSSGQNSSSESADADVAESEKPEESKELYSANDMEAASETDEAVPNA